MSIYKSIETLSKASPVLYDNSVPSSSSFAFTQKEEAQGTRLSLLHKMLSCRKIENKPWGGETLQKVFMIVILQNKFE